MELADYSLAEILATAACTVGSAAQGGGGLLGASRPLVSTLLGLTQNAVERGVTNEGDPGTCNDVDEREISLLGKR